ASGGRAHHLADEAGLDQLMCVGIAVGGGVHDQREIFRTTIAQRTNENIWKAGATKARYEDRRPIGNIGQRLGGARDPLVDRHCDPVSLFPTLIPASCPRSGSPCPTSRSPRQSAC